MDPLWWGGGLAHQLWPGDECIFLFHSLNDTHIYGRRIDPLGVAAAKRRLCPNAVRYTRGSTEVAITAKRAGVTVVKGKSDLDRGPSGSASTAVLHDAHCPPTHRKGTRP